MQVFLNNHKILKGQDNFTNTSENINFLLDPGAKLDNISYSQIVQTETISSTTQTTNADIIGSCFVLSSLTIFYKRKKR